MAKRKLAKALQKYKVQKVEKATKSLKDQRTSNAQLLKKMSIGGGPKSLVKSSKKNDKLPFDESKAWLPFQSHDKLLLVGEGDFSFAISLLNNGLSHEIIATCLDSEEDVKSKYPDTGPENVTQIAQRDTCNVVYSIDATKLTKYKSLRLQNSSSKPFDACVFNFPHLGNSISDQNRNIRQHQQLLLDFFQSAKEFLNPPANIIVTMFEGEPYDSWQIKSLARSKGLYLQQSGKFPWSRFPGYNHMLTLKKGQTSKPQRDRAARIYHFSLIQKQAMKKQPDSDSDSDED